MGTVFGRFGVGVGRFWPGVEDIWPEGRIDNKQRPSSARLEPTDGTKPYKFIRFGAMYATKPCKFIRLGAMYAAKPFTFIGFAATGDCSCASPFGSSTDRPSGHKSSRGGLNRGQIGANRGQIGANRGLIGA